MDWVSFYEALGNVQRYVPETDGEIVYRARAVVKLVPPDVRSVLDVGCGDGYILDYVAKIVKPVEAVGADISGVRVNYARARFPGAEFTREDIYSLGFRDNSFDLVISTEVLEHLEAPEAALAEIARVSSKYVIVSVPYKQKLVVKMCPHCLSTFYDDGHVQSFDAERVARLFRSAGLTIERTLVMRPWEEASVLRRIYGNVKRTFSGVDRSRWGFLFARGRKSVVNGR